MGRAKLWHPLDTLEVLNRAVLMAAEAHAEDLRDGETPLPYLTHVCEVLAICRHEAGVTDVDVLCAAALHDVVEHGHVTVEDIRGQFGERTAALVEELTRFEPGVAGLEPEEAWKLRSETLLAEIGRMSETSQLVKLCDRLSNVRGAFRTKKGRKLGRYVDQSKKILEIVPRSTAPKVWDKIKKWCDKL